MKVLFSSELQRVRSLDSIEASVRGRAHWIDAPYRWNLTGAEEAVEVLRREDSQAASARIRREEHLRGRVRAEFLEATTQQGVDGAGRRLTDAIAAKVKRLMRRIPAWSMGG
jgi:hypothetical protein